MAPSSIQSSVIASSIAATAQTIELADFDDSDAVDVVNDIPDDDDDADDNNVVMVAAAAPFNYPPPIPAEQIKYIHTTPIRSSVTGITPIGGTPNSRSSSGRSRKKASGRGGSGGNGGIGGGGGGGGGGGNNKDSGTSSGEERWLDAIESGKLEQVDDELKKIKDPKLMTARQRAMYERNTDKEPSPGGEILMALPSGYKEKVMTAEAIQKAQIKSQKRKQLADEKREKDKKKTMERLLKKQDSKIAKNQKNKPAKMMVPMISYYSTVADGERITFPPTMEIPLMKHQKSNKVISSSSSDVKKQISCAICAEPKRYNCSRTNLPLCSFKCYKKNVESLRKIMC